MHSEQDNENRACHYGCDVQVSIPKPSAGKQPDDQQEKKSTFADVNCRDQFEPLYRLSRKDKEREDVDNYSVGKHCESYLQEGGIYGNENQREHADDQELFQEKKPECCRDLLFDVRKLLSRPADQYAIEEPKVEDARICCVKKEELPVTIVRGGEVLGNDQALD